MKRTILVGTALVTVLMLGLPFLGGAGPSILVPAYAGEAAMDAPVAAPKTVTFTTGSAPISTALVAKVFAPIVKSLVAAPVVDSEHAAQKPVPKPLPPVTATGAASGTNERRAALESRGLSCPSNLDGTTGGAPAVTSAGGVGGTTSDDLASFAVTFNQVRVDNCLLPVPPANIRYDACMEQRLFWMAEDPSTNPASAWGHMGSQRSDGVPSVGCDGNLAGGTDNTGATVATKWWNSTAHRLSLYKPSYAGGTGDVCIYFAMSHGGVPDEPYAFTRAAARWGEC
ncbi:hypothetical protein BH11ACT3_BH11ACT3_26570 [soil metagenome]